MSRTLVVFVFMSLAAYRATRLLVGDAILDGPRDWLERRLAERPKLRDAVTCVWCVGAYVSAVTVALTDWQTSVPFVALQVPAVMAAVGILSRFVDE